jgi:membrane protein implicated in regulation of membrane protease activity
VSASLAWLLAGVALCVLELFTLAFVLGMVGIGALTAAVAALLGAPLWLQLVAFTGSSAALLVFARPPVQRALNRGPWATTDARALTGSTAIVVERVSDDSGQVRLNGELWRARPYAGTGPVDAGRPVSVAEVNGATLLVYSPDLS